MSRLTRKSNREYYNQHIRSVDDNYTYEQFLKDRPYTLHHIHSVEYETKLGKLEDIEEVFGCPLEVVFKALISGIIVRNNEDLIEIGYSDREDKYVNFSTEEIYLKNWQSHGIEKTTNCFQITYGDDGEWCVYLDGYKKTWWLPSDKEWKDG